MNCPICNDYGMTWDQEHQAMVCLCGVRIPGFSRADVEQKASDAEDRLTARIDQAVDEAVDKVENRLADLRAEVRLAYRDLRGAVKGPGKDLAKTVLRVADDLEDAGSWEPKNRKKGSHR